ncbi:MAG: decaprenyl-phosphate phosphoribosyltransferase [Flexilinea sp.]
MRKNPYLNALRIRQWPKNGFVLAPLIFDGQLFNPPALAKTIAGIIIFCVLSSGIYVFNDIIDVHSDREHPRKKNRPVASGKIPIRNAWLYAVILVCTACGTAFILDRDFFLITLVVVAINIIYTLKLKHLPIIDVMTIGTLFILRVLAGASLVVVKIFSPWIYVVTFMLALYLGFGKRRAELAMLADKENLTRPVLDGYSLPLLDQLITIVSSVTIFAYTLYTFSGPTLPENYKMMLTIPFVVYAIFRYHYLIQIKHAGGAPEEVLLSDRPLQITIFLYALTVILAIYL